MGKNLKKCIMCGKELPNYFFLKANEKTYGNNQYICIFCVFNLLDINAGIYEEKNIWESLKDSLSEEYYKKYKIYKSI